MTQALLELGGSVSLLPLSSKEPLSPAGRMPFHQDLAAQETGETRAQ